MTKSRHEEGREEAEWQDASEDCEKTNRGFDKKRNGEERRKERR